MDVDWDDLKTVLAVVRTGSLSAAGAELGVNYTTVSRRIQRAEVITGEVLFERLPSGYRATDTANLMADHAAAMEEEKNALLRKMQGRSAALEGAFTVTAPQLMIGPHLARVLAGFQDAHPRVALRIRATNELLDLNRREADLAIRISRNPGDTLTGLRLCQQQTASFASPEIAVRIADDPSAPQDWIVYEQTPDLPQIVRDTQPNARVRMTFDDMVALIGAAQQGLGIVRMPMFLGRATPGLVQVPSLPPQPYPDVWVVGHPDVWRSAKAAAFRSILVPHFRENRAAFVA